jgi:hypothetical protein
MKIYYVHAWDTLEDHWHIRYFDSDDSADKYAKQLDRRYRPVEHGSAVLDDADYEIA